MSVPNTAEKRANDTQVSTTDPDAKLYNKRSQKAAAIPACLGHMLTEHRNGLVVDERLTQPSGTAGREAAL